MDTDFESELKGSLDDATKAKEKIEKYFKRYGESKPLEVSQKHQLMLASKIICIITKIGDKHLDIYCNIITQTFGNQLNPEISLKYWTLYVNCIRYFHYTLVNKKQFENASAIYKHISSYHNKLQSAEIGNILVNIYCYQLYLQNSLRSKDKETAIRDGNEVLKNLTKLFKDILETNKNLNFQYPDLLKNTIQWLFPSKATGTVYQFLNSLQSNYVQQMFKALFTLYGLQTITPLPTPEDVQNHAQNIIETLYVFLQIDVMDKFHLQLAVNLLSHCRNECRIKSNKPIAEFFQILYAYLKQLCAQEPTLHFQEAFSLRCKRLLELFEQYSKKVTGQPWFGNFLVLIYFIHSQLQNSQIFGCFWKQMNQSNCYKSMFELLVECMKLAPCISSETKLFSITCCSSARKHIIFAFAQVALAAFVFYCQNVDEDEELSSSDNNLNDVYMETIHKSLTLIMNHAFKIIDKMDCITSTSQEINILLTRFKQATVSAKTSKHAGTCLSICEQFLKIKKKITSNEWLSLLRRLYKTVTSYVISTPNLGRDIQMCYILSMLHESISQIDIGQIRSQIQIFYVGGSTNEQVPQQLQHENCLLQLHATTTSLFRPQLEASRKKLLHWLDSQHIVRYHKSNTALLHSILKYSQSQYDFVILTKTAKLQTYAAAKISSLYKNFSSKSKELGSLSRLDQLTFAHVCSILLREEFANTKVMVESKDLSEEKLESLLLREEMETFTIDNELKRLKLALKAYTAFEDFYKKFDQEMITMDEAIIDWDAIVDDLTFLAQHLQLAGYIEYSCAVWLLQYKCSCLIQNDYSALRSLAFFCEYSEFYEKNNTNILNLETEIKLHFPAIIVAMENLSAISKSNQNHVLLAVLQIAYYYGRSSNLTFCQMLLQFVEEKHYELPERQDCYDVVLLTLDIIRFRLMWKTANDKLTDDRTTVEKSLMHRNLLHEMDQMLDRLHNFQCNSSNDGLCYVVIVISLIQEMAECTANRLCDNFLISVFLMTSKYALHYGLVLRLVQVMSMWMWVNLQMEYVDKAQMQLKLIEYVLGIRSIKDLTEINAKAMIDIQSSTLLPTPSKQLISINHNPGMEAMRKLAQVQLSPIKTDKLQLDSSTGIRDLKRYFECNIDSNLLPNNEKLEWTYFTVGCLSARLYFLVEDYEQLETFYEKGWKWLETRKNAFNKQYYKNIQLMSMQHYVNFLRSQRRYDKALQCLEQAIELCGNWKLNVDAVYSVNFQLQLISTRIELDGGSHSGISNKENKLRRALVFNVSPEHNKELHEQAKQAFKEKMLQQAMGSNKQVASLNCPSSVASAKKVTTSSKKVITTTSFKPVVTDCPSSSRKPKVPTASSSGSSSSNNAISSNLEIKSTKPKNKPKFEICEDSIEVIELDDSIKVIESNPENANDLIPTKRTKTTIEQYTTPKIPRKNTKSSTKTTGTAASSNKIKRPAPPPTQLNQQQAIEIDVDDSSSSSSTPILSSSISSLDDFYLDTNDLVTKMKTLEIKLKKIPTAETKSKSRGRKAAAIKPTTSATVIVLDDSPIVKLAKDDVVDVPKMTRTRIKTDKTPNIKSTEPVTSSRPRRQRIVLENNENDELAPSSSAVVAGASLPQSSVSRRRQKI